MKRMGKPEDVANACIFFASALADWITGAALEKNEFMVKMG